VVEILDLFLGTSPLAVLLSPRFLGDNVRYLEQLMASDIIIFKL
jgi:hypothetical protein